MSHPYRTQTEIQNKKLTKLQTFVYNHATLIVVLGIGLFFGLDYWVACYTRLAAGLPSNDWAAIPAAMFLNIMFLFLGATWVGLIGIGVRYGILGLSNLIKDNIIPRNDYK